MPGSIRLMLHRKSSNARKSVSPTDNSSVIQPERPPFTTLHCAAYSTREKRATLHARMGDARGGASRARNVLQHGLKWMLEKRFRDALDGGGGGGQAMLGKLVAMRNDLPTVEVGYSLPD